MEQEPTGREKEKKRYLRFVEAIDLFPEEEREPAQYCAELYRAANWRKHPERYEEMVDFIKELLKQKGEEVRRCKLFHLFAGSTLPEYLWREFPLDTPEGDFQRFAKEKLKNWAEEERN